MKQNKTKSLLFIALNIIISYTITQIYSYFLQESPGVCPHDPNSCYFTNGYYQSRSLFRELGSKVGAKLYQERIYVKENGYEDDLTIDIAILQNEKSKKNNTMVGPLMLHVSGTHGVEGYSGSAIQIAFLDKLSKGEFKIPDNVNVVLVHALNPFGFLYNRRPNENNVDLNRNVMLNQNEFQKLKVSGGGAEEIYKIFDKLFNEDEPWSYPLSLIKFVFKVVYYYLRYGFFKIKQALVSGQYTKPQGLYFGGLQYQNSTQILINLMTKQLKVQDLSNLIFIDVHTGLGPQGIDTLMAEPYLEPIINTIYDQSPEQMANSLLGTNFFVDVGGELSKDVINPLQTDVSKGYEYAQGMMDNILSVTGVKRGLMITQEFGTVSGFFVVKAMIEEGAAYFKGNKEQKAQGCQATKNVFHVESQQFKQNVVDRGLIVIKQSLQALSQDNLLNQFPSVPNKYQ